MIDIAPNQSQTFSGTGLEESTQDLYIYLFKKYLVSKILSFSIFLSNFPMKLSTEIFFPPRDMVSLSTIDLFKLGCPLYFVFICSFL